MTDSGPDPVDQESSPEQRAREHASGMNRRAFLGLAGGGAAATGLAGAAIGYWAADTGSVETLTPAPSEAADSNGQAADAEGQPAAAGGAGEMLVFYPRLRVASVSELGVGEPVAFEYPLQGQAAEIVKLGKPAKFGVGPDSDIVAFSTICPHMGWPLAGLFRPEECLWGPCRGHLSTFDAAVGGQVTLGQATEDLPQVVLSVDDEDVYAEGVLGLIYGYRDNLRDGTAVEVDR